jgi:nicotinamide-nucleotide amidase
METRFAATGRAMSGSMLRQVRVPAGAHVYDNSAGLAPGFEVAVGGVPVFCLPGPPRELKAIFQAALETRLVELRERAGQPERIARRIYRVFGRGESQIAAELAGLMEGVAGASLHYQVAFPETLVKVVVRDRDRETAGQKLAALDRAVCERIGRWLYQGDSLAQALGEALSARCLILATAESCTGGLLGALITGVPGASRYFAGGAVTYADGEKVRLLGVAPATLERYGAVSEETAGEMALGMRAAAGADLAAAVSGIAGPGGGSEDKPVGTVWLAVAGPGPDDLLTRRYVWLGARDQIRTLAAWSAMALVLRAIAGSRSESE